jgi:hypothetical protein
MVPILDGRRRLWINYTLRSGPSLWRSPRSFARYYRPEVAGGRKSTRASFHRGNGESYMIHDTPVYDQQHNPHERGRAAAGKTLVAIVSPSLFDDGQMMRLVVAGMSFRASPFAPTRPRSATQTLATQCRPSAHCGKAVSPFPCRGVGISTCRPQRDVTWRQGSQT